MKFHERAETRSRRAFFTLPVDYRAAPRLNPGDARQKRLIPDGRSRAVGSQLVGLMGLVELRGWREGGSEGGQRWQAREYSAGET
jgi:hypothetical protein